MKQKPSSKRRRNSAKSILRLPGLEHAKAAVLNSLNSTDAIGPLDFLQWLAPVPLRFEAFLIAVRLCCLEMSIFV
jgi:hypothetical protein